MRLLHYQPGKPLHISVVELKGLEIHLPPKSHFIHSGSEAAAKPAAADLLLSFGVDAVECTGAHFVLETSKPGKLPVDIAIARFRLTGSNGGSIGAEDAMKFEAELTNPRPVGTIHSTGSFGPWLVSDPGESPITGEYQFDHADLSGFKGIAAFSPPPASTRARCATWRWMATPTRPISGLPTLAMRCPCTPTSTRSWTPPMETRGWSRWMPRWAARTLPRRGRWCACRPPLRRLPPARPPARGTTLPSTSTWMRRILRTFCCWPTTLQRRC